MGQEDALKAAIEFLEKNPKTAKALGVSDQNIKLITGEVTPSNQARVLNELEKIAPIAEKIGEIGVDTFGGLSIGKQAKILKSDRLKGAVEAEMVHQQGTPQSLLGKGSIAPETFIANLDPVDRGRF